MRKKFTNEELLRIYKQMKKCIPVHTSIPKFAVAYGITVSTAYKAWRIGKASEIPLDKHQIKSEALKN